MCYRSKKHGYRIIRVSSGTVSKLKKSKTDLARTRQRRSSLQSAAVLAHVKGDVAKKVVENKEGLKTLTLSVLRRI